MSEQKVNKAVDKAVRQKGRELTPEEVAEVIESVTGKKVTPHKQPEE